MADAVRATSQGPPLVWVIALNWNGRDWLTDCLTSVLAMTYPNYKVLMVDNGSTDDSVALVRREFPSVGILELDRNLGYAGGFSAGMEVAHREGAEYFLIMNNDTVIDRGALSALVDVATSRERCGFVTGKVYFHERPDVLQTVGKQLDPVRWNGDHVGRGEVDYGQYDETVERPFLDDVFTLASGAMYAEIGGYDTQFFLNCEEFDWQARAKKRGWRFYYTPGAKIWHKVSMSMGGMGSPIAWYFDMRSAIAVMAMHAGARRFLRFYAWAANSSLRSLLAGLQQRGSEPLRPRLAGFLGFMSGTLWLLHRRPPRRVPLLVRMLAS